MAPDKLEKFILENRDDFDDLSPTPQSWEKVKANIKPVRQINWTSRLVRIAAAVVIFVSSYIFIDYTLKSAGDAELQAGDANMEMYENIPVLVEARAYYSSQITNMEDEVYRLAGADSPISNDIKIEFEELDEVFNELKTDLKDDAANEEVIEAMIQNYRIKLQILQEILIQLKNADEQNTVDHEDKKVLL